ACYATSAVEEKALSSGACYKVWVDVSANVTCVKTTLFADEMQISSLSSPEDRAFSSTADVA
ncbi:MAG: hypothetical protein AAFQ57_09475, partial [Cyanobacteria bacterium J06626_14]